MMEDQIRVLAEGVIGKLGDKSVDMVEVLVDFGVIVLEKFSTKYMVLKMEEAGRL